MKPNRLLFFCVIGLILAALAGGAFWYGEQMKPVAPTDAKQQTIKVKSGMTTGAIADALLEKGLIRNRTAFLLAARQAGLDKSLQAGEYAFSRSMNVGQIIEIMAKGITVYSEFTIPEGFTVEQIAGLLEEKGLARKERFLALAKTYSPFDKTDRPDVKYRAEGFLFPDTYRIGRGASEEMILQTMAQEFAEKFTPELQARLDAFDIHPTGPLWGAGELRTSGPAREFELAAMAGDTAARLQRGLERAELQQERRNLRLRPAELAWVWHDDGALELRFTLPPGCYATTLLRELGDIRDTHSAAA